MKCTNSIMIKKMNKKPKEIVSDCAALLFLENKPENKPSRSALGELCGLCCHVCVRSIHSRLFPQDAVSLTTGGAWVKRVRSALVTMNDFLLPVK